MSSISGLGFSGPVNLLVAFIVVLAVIGVTAWGIRRITRERMGSAGRSRQPRLAILDTAAVDARRQLVIIRRDNVEHLLMIGGGSDLVIETNIVRANAANAGREPASRTPPVLDAPRVSSVYEGASWPAPQPEMTARLQRTYPIEEQPQWPATVQQEPASRGGSPVAAEEPMPLPPPIVRAEPNLRTQRAIQQEASQLPPIPREVPVRPPAAPGSLGPALRAPPAEPAAATPSESDRSGIPVARFEPSPGAAPLAAPATTAAARLAGRLDVPPRQNVSEPSWGGNVPKPPRQPAAGPQSAEEVLTPPDRQADEGQPATAEDLPKSTPNQRFSFPNVRFDRTAPARTTPPPLKPERQPGSSASVRPPPDRAPLKPKSRTIYESLEQEMASLLGKPPEKN